MPAIKIATGSAPATPASGYVSIYAQADADIAWVDSSAVEHVASQVGHTHTGSEVTDFVEVAQDAVGAMLVDGTTIDLTYTDATPALTAEVKAASLANSYLANMAEATVKGRAAAAGTGAPVDLTPAQVLAIVAATAQTWTAMHYFGVTNALGLAVNVDTTGINKACRLQTTGALATSSDGDMLHFYHVADNLWAIASQDNSTYRHLVLNPGGGYVGIGTGTSAPTSALQVAGTVNATALQQGGVGVSLSTHNHDGTYATAAHNHDGTYATAAHNHDGTYATAASVADSDWVEITSYESGWSATNNSGETAARVRKVGNLVMCKGGVESTATHSSGTGKTAFTLPEGYRPSDRRVFAGYNDLAAPISLRVESDGTVYITNNSAGTISANTTTYHLDSIAFLI